MARQRQGEYHICLKCGRPIYRTPADIKNGLKIFCSRECSQKALVGKNHARWKGGEFITKAGYKMLRINGKYLLEHRVVMEKHLGRKLLSSESVHHKDENKLNNNIDNLVMISRSAHQEHHNNGFKRLENKGCWVCEEMDESSDHYSRGFCQSHYEKYMRRKRRFNL